MEATIIWRLLKAMNVSQLWLVPLCFLLAEVVTDFVSGVAHWLCDTWGRLDTPIVGPTFIRSFREHHIDPSAICNHDFIETNADPSLFSVALNTYLIFLRPWNPDSQYDMALYLFALFGGLLAAFTNEFHKWSHMVGAYWLCKTANYSSFFFFFRFRSTSRRPGSKCCKTCGLCFRVAITPCIIGPLLTNTTASHQAISMRFWTALAFGVGSK